MNYWSVSPKKIKRVSEEIEYGLYTCQDTVNAVFGAILHQYKIKDGIFSKDYRIKKQKRAAQILETQDLKVIEDFLNHRTLAWMRPDRDFYPVELIRLWS